MKKGDLVRHKSSKWLGIIHEVRTSSNGIWIMTFTGHVMYGCFNAYEVINADR